MKATFVILFALVAFVAANKGGFQFPQSCKNDGENVKKCYEDYVRSRDVKIKVEDVMKCFARFPLYYTYCL